MPFNFKEKEELVQNVITRLAPVLPENVDLTIGTPLRNIIEAIMEEVDIQYWQLEQTYNSAYIDTATDTDLDKLVALLGIIREPAIQAIGIVTFYRLTPAEDDYFIPEGTLVETLPDALGNTVVFQTTEDVVLLTGQSEINVNVKCEQPGIIGNIPALTIKTINNPPVGIESVKNLEAMTGGSDTESNEELRERTKHVLDTDGNATVDALFYKIKLTSGVREVTVVDMARGIGTVDILVLTDVVPMTTAKKNELKVLIDNTKAGGIDVALVEPFVINTNITVTLILASGYVIGDVYDGVEKAIINYVNELDIGQSLILNQLTKYILNSSAAIIDVEITNPVDNILIDTDEIIRIGTIIIN